MENNLAKLIEIILEKQKRIHLKSSLLVGISGIDASGKGFITARLADKIRRRGFNVANINIDGWLTLPHLRFNPLQPAENFYKNGLRFDEMFEKLILPLKENRSVNLTADYTAETATAYRPHHYIYQDIDIILLEGIFLFKKEFKNYFDLKIWIECGFETALQRAVSRGQESLSPADTIEAYKTTYFPAQTLHFARDLPQRNVDHIFYNE